MKTPAFKKPEHDGVVIFFPKLRQGRVQQWGDLNPSLRFRFPKRLHIRLLFAVLPPTLNG